MYVRETYCPNYFDEGIAECRNDGLKGNRNAYKADYRKEIVGDVVPEPKWKPSIHMPKEAVRIWLKVKSVRVERLQDITSDGIIAEGVISSAGNPAMGRRWENLQKIEFQKIWDSTINKSDQDLFGWDANPWVWVIEFEQCEQPNEGKNGG